MMEIYPRREHGRVEMRRKNLWVSTNLPTVNGGTFVEKLIQHSHEKTMHVRVASTMAFIRENYINVRHVANGSFGTGKIADS